MRILIVSNLFPPVVRGGYELECADVVRHLAREHEVAVLTTDHRAAEAPDDPLVHRLLPLVEATRTDALRAPAAGVRARRVAERVLAQAGVPDLVFVWNGAGVPFPALDVLMRCGGPVAFRVCEAWFGGMGRDDVLSRYLLGVQPGRLHRAWGAGVRGMARLPGAGLRPSDGPPVTASVLWASRFLQGSVPVPAGVQVGLEEVRRSTTAAAEVFAGVARRTGAEDGVPELLLAGRVDRRKGADVAVRALGALERDHGVRARLLVAGDGDVQMLREEAMRAGVADRVVELGRLVPSELAQVAAGASAWLVPSVWEEPLGMVAAEAAFARVPVVASQVGGLPEILEDEAEALFVCPGDAEALAGAVARLLADPRATAERVRRAAARVTELKLGPHLRYMAGFVERAAEVGPDGHQIQFGRKSIV